MTDTRMQTEKTKFLADSCKHCPLQVIELAEYKQITGNDG